MIFFSQLEEHWGRPSQTVLPDKGIILYVPVGVLVIDTAIDNSHLVLDAWVEQFCAGKHEAIRLSSNHIICRRIDTRHSLS